MSVFDRIWDGLTKQVQLHADTQRALKRLDEVSESLFDHEKRLIKIETIIDLARGGLGPLRLPEG